MKSYLILFAVLFFLIIISFFNTNEDNTMPVFTETIEDYYYEINLEDLNITTDTLKNLNFVTIIRAYPKFSSIYEDRIEQKYYNFDTKLSVIENSTNMRKRYLFLLSHYGLIHDKQEYQVIGIPISKIIIIGTNRDYEKIKNTYDIKQIII